MMVCRLSQAGNFVNESYGLVEVVEGVVFFDLIAYTFPSLRLLQGSLDFFF